MGGGAGFTGGTPLKGGGGQLGGGYGQYAPPPAQVPGMHRGLGAGVGTDAWISSHPNFHNNFVQNQATGAWQHRANPLQPQMGAPSQQGGGYGYQPQGLLGPPATQGQNEIAQIYQQMFGGGWGGGLGPFKLY